MRAGVWCAAALALLAVASALRPTQVEGSSRISRRPLHTYTEEPTSPPSIEDASPRSRGSRRRDDIIPRHTARSRTRTRPAEEEIVETEVNTRSRSNDRVEPRRTSSRVRSRLEEVDPVKANVIRSRTRNFRPAPTPPTVTAKAPEVSSPIIDESKIEVINSTLEDIPKMVFKEDTTTKKNRRKSSTPQAAESIAPRRHGRINTRPNERADLASSGTTNSISISEREPTTDKMMDLRKSKKLRYKQRLSETDTNLTGFGITANEATKSSQNQNSITNETSSITVENIQQSTETNPLKTTTLKVMRIVKRPVQRGKGGFKPSASEVEPKKRSDEISDDDNYPEPFKALLQAKNASTQTSSPISESLSVKASHKVHKTYTSSQQSTFTSPSRNKYSRLRSKSNKEEDLKTEEKPSETTVAPRVFSTRQPSKYRSSYAAKNRKFNTSTTIAIGSTDQSSEKPNYKFNRKFKATESPKSEEKMISKQVETNNLLKRTLNRPSFYARRNSSKNDVTPAPSAENNVNVASAIESITKHKASLPRTSYYMRHRNNKIVTTSTEESFKENNSLVDTADRKNVDNADMPLIFTLLKPSEVPQTGEDNESDSKTQKSNKMFVIAVTSKESYESSTENEMTSNTVEEIRPKSDIEVFATPKYHATYSVPQSTSTGEEKVVESSSALPPIKNLRKFGRTRTNTRSQNDNSSNDTVTRDRGSGKFSDSFSKTTEASTNGINAEAEKSKSRFSSKYRAAYLEKPFYRATVPTVTPSTAWLKFFVTDRLLTKFVEDPSWFEEDYTDSTTPVSRLNFTPPITHESSIQLIQGEEFQLGPDMNAITFTQTRSPAEILKLSESLVKPSHVMNVEASQHSPSVTVSIFDALAEILTSTPRNRLSSTTEASQNQNINTALIQPLNGVSNSIYVNSGVLAKKDTLLNVNVNTNTNLQNTVQTPNVNNPAAAGGGAPTTPNPSPSTPVSARRPFAFKVLYSDTDAKPTDKLTTAPEPTTNLPTTDNPTMVYNTVSDLLLLNNNVVSSELTSMLSSNINSILRNMDDRTRSRLSADMAKILKSVIPRAIDGLEDSADSIPNTTPYSLEEIKDTENVEFDLNVNNSSVSVNPLQGVDPTNVNITISPVNTTNGSDFSQVVNSPGMSQLTTSSLVTVSDIRTTTANFDKTTSPSTTERTTSTPISSSTITTSRNFAVSSDISDSDILVVDSLANDNTRSNAPNVPLPFLTNFQINDFNGSDSGIANNNSVSLQSQPMPYSTVPMTLTTNDDGSNIQDINDVTPLQLWILSRKARVLEMIEDLLRTHNNELANATKLTEMFGKASNSPISARLTEIMTSMNSSDSPNDSSLSTIPSLPAPSSTQSSNNSSGDGLVGSVTPSGEGTARSNVDLAASTDFADSSTSTPPTTSKAETATSPLSTMETIVDLSNRALNDSSTTTILEETSTQTIEMVTTTVIATTTPMAQEATTQNDMETTTEVDIETTTITNDQTKNASTSGNQFNLNNNSSIRKKDYVIFGILPNNTVVRKDPNDDILESITEASPYIIYGVLPNNTIIRRFPNGTRVPRVMQKIDILPISPWSLRNPYSPIHNNPAIVRPQFNPTRVSTNVGTSSNNETDRLTTIDTVNNLQNMISTSTLNLKDSSSGVTTVANKPAEQSTASHVLSLRTTTMLPSVDEILLNSLSSAAKEEMVISSMTSSTRQPTILTLDIDPETKQIRTEKPGEGNDSAVFKFIPIDEVSVTSQNSNVLKLASSKSPTTEMSQTQSTTETMVTEMNTQTPQIQAETQSDDPTTTAKVTVGTAMDATTETATMPSLIMSTSTETVTTPAVITETPTIATTTAVPVTTTTETTTTTTKATTTTTTEAVTTTAQPTTITTTTTTEAPTPTITTTTTTAPTTKLETETMPSTTVSLVTDPVTKEEAERYQEDAKLLQAFLDGTERIPKKLNFNSLDQNTGTTSINMKTTPAMTTQQSDEDKFLQALLASAGKNENSVAGSNTGSNIKVPSGVQTTTTRSIEDDIRQFEEDTKLLKALLQATGQNPANFNIPTLNFKTTPIPTTTETTTTIKPTEKIKPQTTTPSTTTDAKFEENAKLLQALLQATGQNNANFNIPDISGLSSVRIASNPYTTSLGSSPTTPVNIRPVYTTLNTSPQPRATTMPPSTTVPTTLQPRTEATTVRISTTFPPFQQRKQPTTMDVPSTTLPTARRVPSSRFAVTTEIPTSSTFSVEEDLAFLNNLKSVLSTNTNTADPEAALANRIIALAVDRSLNEIKTGKVTERTGKNIVVTTTTTTTTTTPRPTTPAPSTPSIEDDIKQFQEDTKLLQALLKATGQDPSKLNLPTLPNLDTKVSSNLPLGVNKDLDLLSNLLASPSPLNEPFDSLTQKPKEQAKTTSTPVTRPFGAKIAVKDDVKSVQDDGKLLQTLIQLQGVQETTTAKSKIAITGQSTDEALKKLIQQTKQTGTPSVTKAPIAISTEYGKSNDALLAALLKEQGFGPTTASSLDEQIRLAALLNQVVVTPKARRTTTPPPPPPPPAPRRPILDGLAWLWQQWRDTGPGPGGNRPRRPEQAPTASMSASQTTSNRVNWFGSGPFTGNADERPTSNRVPLEPPRAVTSEQTPGRGQLVSAAINVTRAFSQFLGAAIQGAAQTVQSVIRAGQRAATDMYTSGSGASG